MRTLKDAKQLCQQWPNKEGRTATRRERGPDDATESTERDALVAMVAGRKREDSGCDDYQLTAIDAMATVKAPCGPAATGGLTTSGLPAPQPPIRPLWSHWSYCNVTLLPVPVPTPPPCVHRLLQRQTTAPQTWPSWRPSTNFRSNSRRGRRPWLAVTQHHTHRLPLSLSLSLLLLWLSLLPAPTPNGDSPPQGESRVRNWQRKIRRPNPSIRVNATNASAPPPSSRINLFAITIC
jgi:hypothetical protein